MALNKMKIKPYKRSNATELTVSINPESYQINYQATTIERGPSRKSRRVSVSGDEIPRRVTDHTKTLSFDVWFDCTGAVPDSKDVIQEIAALRKLLVMYQGNIHSPRLVEVYWGRGLSWRGQCTKMDISYTLFDAKGNPLRAKASLSFDPEPNNKLRVKEKGKSSPDLTHVRIVRDGDHLPLMCHRIYNDSSYYLQVAKVNGLTNFMDIRPGQRIFFPPLGD